MELTESQFRRLKTCLPVQRRNVRLHNRLLLNAILYVVEQGCKWRGLPPRFGNWHTVHTRMNRWSNSGVLQRVFERMQAVQMIAFSTEALSLDSTSIMVHPDDSGALKKTARRP